MRELTRRYVLSLLGAMLLAMSPVMAQNRPSPFLISGPDYGVALTPHVYFVNFLFMYWSNPQNAANMPAYRAPIPREFANCLLGRVARTLPISNISTVWSSITRRGAGPSSEAFAHLRPPVSE